MNSPSNEIVALLFFLVFIVSYLGVSRTRSLALRWNHVAYTNERSSHIAPVPYGGGIILVVVNGLAWLIFARVHPGLSWGHALAAVGGALIVGGISFIDDWRHVPFPIRLLCHGLAAGLFVFGWGAWNIVDMPVLGIVALGAASVPITILWMVGITNAYNFIDGIDGLAGGQAIGAGFGWLLLGILTQYAAIAVAGVVLAASSLGFLMHNWHPATIFLGDVGSTFLGYSFGALAIVGARYDPRLALCGVLLVWPAIFDSGFTVLRRLRHRQSIFVGHRTFLFHRLVNAGWSHQATATLYIPLPICGALLAATWRYGDRFLHWVVLGLLLLLCLGLWLIVRYQELHGPQSRVSKQEMATRRRSPQHTHEYASIESEADSESTLTDGAQPRSMVR